MQKFIDEKLKTEPARIEFGIFTGFVLVSLVFNIVDITRIQLNNDGLIAGPIMETFFYHLIIGISYIMLCFYVTPVFESRSDKASNSVYIFAFISICILLDIINVFFAALLGLKILLTYFNRNKQNQVNAYYHEVALLAASWILILAGAFYINVIWPKIFILYSLPVLMMAYLYAIYRILPKAQLKGRKFLYYLSRMFFMALLTTLGYVIFFKIREEAGPGTYEMFTPDNIRRNLIILGNIHEDTQVLIVVGNFFVQLLIITPLAWSIYKKRNEKKEEEITMLRTELGQSDANLNFLKSQINPHFLFNALNTLYGTALQENAERTGEGIQKLGDMMRFMLQENTQDKILLSRDIDYLRNYILLQQLRTATSEGIVINTQIADYAGNLMIAPMLLIPFVENAFKHGISLINPSHIKVTLQTKDNTLYFDVHNSTHIRNENDPEKDHSGIGLENVKQRLNLLYPERHELIIRETGSDFFIHITLQLDANS
ncbi:sensor histidine kinase [Mucilaginibacter antarcticus]|uniref:Sensor histidine kinase n=1 Tax=Mucilaginibacter antarcticus TaxID=1855725 RepID=A0ABW5XKH6_9SPHI